MIPSLNSPRTRARVADVVPFAMIAIGAVGCAWPFVAEVVL